MLCSLKTVFLPALASVRRWGGGTTDYLLGWEGSELHQAWDDITHSGWISAKMGIPSHILQLFYITAPTPFSGRDNDDRRLCPVRALRFYLFTTSGYHSSERLFRKVRGEGHVSSQTISALLVRSIKTCYENQQIYVHANEVPRVSASGAYVGGPHSLEDSLSAGTWASHNTFSSVYLADVQTQPNARLRPQHIISGKLLDCKDSNFYMV